MRKALLLAALLLGLSLLPAVASEAPVIVMLTTNATAYKVGDSLVVTVYVMRGTDPIDVDAPPVVTIGSWGSEREKNTTWTQTGRYQVILSLRDTDIDPVLKLIELATEVTVEEETYTISTTRSLISFEQFSFSYDPTAPQPGDTVEITIEGWKGTQPAKVNGLKLKLNADTMEEPKTLAVNKLGTGIYRTSFEIPQNLFTSTLYRLTATGTINGVVIEETQAIAVPLFHLWYRTVILNEEVAVFDVWVLDQEGHPISDASMTGNLTINVGEEDVQWVDIATSADEHGILRLTAQFEAGKDLLLRANVNYGGLQAEFNHYTFIDDSLWIRSKGFAVEGITCEELYPGEQADCTFRIWDDGVQQNGTGIYYTLTTDTTLLAFGERTTDSQGQFVAEFTVPMDSTERLELTAYPTETVGSLTDSDYVMLPSAQGSSLYIASSGFKPGNWASVSCKPIIKMTDVEFWVTAFDPENPENYWSYYGDDYFATSILLGTNGYSYKVPIPLGLPADYNYGVVVYATSANSLEYTEWVVVKPGADEGEGGSILGNLPTTIIAAGILGVLVLAGVVGMVIWRLNRRALVPPMSGIPLTPGGYPAAPAPPMLGTSAAATFTPATPPPPMVGTTTTATFTPATPPPPMATIECPGCRVRMKVLQIGRPQQVRCDACGLKGEIEI